MENSNTLTVQIKEPPLYPKQRAFVYDPARYTVVEASTKSGKTVGCLWWLATEAFKGKRGQNVWWVAPVNSQAEIAFRRFKAQFQGTNQKLLAQVSNSRLFIVLANGVRISFKSAEKPDNLYGEDVYAVVIDEASRVREEAYYALDSTTTATLGKMKIIGNVKGRRNWFYQKARLAQSEPETVDPAERIYSYHKLTAYDAVEAGVLAAEEIEVKKRDLPPHVFRELFLAEAADETTNPFGDVASCAVEGLSDGVPVAWGWDFAKHNDFNVGIALDGEGRVCRFLRWNRTTYDVTIDLVKQNTQNVPAAVDATHGSVGDPIFDQLQQATDQYEAVEFTKRSRQQLLLGLATAIHQKDIQYPRNSAIMNELDSFEFVPQYNEVRWQVADGMHDDCVFALALAVWKWQQGQRTSRGPVAIFAGMEEWANTELAGMFTTD